MAAENQYKLKVKVNNNDDTRLWRNASPNDFEGLCLFITSTWNIKDFIAQYEDDEADLITIASAQDLEDAFEFAQEENKKSLKIFVQNNIKQKRVPTQTQTQTQPQPPQNNDNEPQLEQKQEPKQFNSVTEMAFDFLTNKEIMTLLPEMFGVLINKLTEKGNNLKVDQIIAMINEEITNNEQFKVITYHPLYVKYGQLAIPYIAQKIAAQQSLYPHFKLETIKTWITQLLQMFGQAMQQMNGKDKCCAFKDIVIDIQYPTMTDTGKVIHFGVECDLCGQYPIIGDRYKCSICEDWDCCPACEPKHDHPLIKFKKSSKSHQNASFKGLTEIVKRLSGQNDNNKPESKENELDVEAIDIYDEIICDCICGTKMECIMAKKAYNRCNTIYCDGCSAQLFNEMVYHCPKNKDPIHHKNGYDLCPKCADKKVLNDKEKEKEIAKEEENNNNNEQENEEEEQELFEEEQPKEEEFEYAAQLTQIKQIMGYNTADTDELVKQMLMEHKGDIAKVVPLLLQ